LPVSHEADIVSLGTLKNQDRREFHEPKNADKYVAEGIIPPQKLVDYLRGTY